MRHYDSTLDTAIVIDGVKYQKIGAQQLRINNLDAEDEAGYICRAVGLSDKTTNVHLQNSEYNTHFVDDLLYFQHCKWKKNKVLKV